MRNKVKVTIGLCTKNAEATIKEAVDGILGQDFPHELMELIVVDGCSEDRTLMIIKEKLVNSDIKSRIFEESVGLGMARQIVVDNANGDYIVWADSDIILPHDYVKKQVEFMEKNPNVGVAEGKYGMYPGEGLVAALENIVAVIHSSSSVSKLSCLAATEGAIWRVKAIREAGGFDVAIKGAAEDIEAAYRIKTAGWSLCVTNEMFQEACRETWKSLWAQYHWYGYGAHYLHHKDRGMITLYKMLPPSGFLAGVLYSFSAYKLTRRKTVFLLPIHYAFKRIAWCFGFAKGHIDGYGH
jgi:glycosyltransferase involved in cell wall biosynthesis